VSETRKERLLDASNNVKNTDKSNRELCPQNDIIRPNDMLKEGSGIYSDVYYPHPLLKFNGNQNFTSPSYRLGQIPRYGEHRCEKNVVLAFAHGYQVKNLIYFVTSLYETGYDGDLVIGLGTVIDDQTRPYLESLARTRPGFVVYEIPLICQRTNSCQTTGFFEKTDGTATSEWLPLPDPRPFRRVSVVRYEYYWAWAKRYNPESLILISDARDVYFQRDPMQVVQASAELNKNTIMFFEEALKIKQSKANQRWIKNTYPGVQAEVEDRMVVCSGNTMGAQPAIEVYARAMLYEFDKTRCKRCANMHDQGFHNYLIYKNRLIGANGGAIKKVVVHPQGKGGVVNTMGKVATINGVKSLEDLGLLRAGTYEVLENDKREVSAVVHMYDRDAKLNKHIEEKIQALLKQNNIIVE